MMNAFSINVTSNDTDEISEELKVKFVNRNKNSSKCVAKQVGALETPTIVPEIFSKTKYAKSYKPKGKGVSNKKLLSPLAFGQLSTELTATNYMKKRSSAKICLNDQSIAQGSLLFKLDKGGQFEKILEDCFKKGVDFEEAMLILKKENLMEELSVDGESKNKTGNIHVKSDYYEDFKLNNYSPGTEINCFETTFTGDLKESSNNICSSDTCKIYSKNTANTNNSNELGCCSSNKCSSSSITDNLNNSDHRPSPENFKLKFIKNNANYDDHDEYNYNGKSEMSISQKSKPYEIAVNDEIINSPLKNNNVKRKSNEEKYKEYKEQFNQFSQFNQENSTIAPELLKQINRKKDIDRVNSNNDDFHSDVSD
jgi:hypothetical protein